MATKKDRSTDLKNRRDRGTRAVQRVKQARGSTKAEAEAQEIPGKKSARRVVKPEPLPPGVHTVVIDSLSSAADQLFSLGHYSDEQPEKQPVVPHVFDKDFRLSNPSLHHLYVGYAIQDIKVIRKCVKKLHSFSRGTANDIAMNLWGRVCDLMKKDAAYHDAAAILFTGDHKLIASYTREDSHT